MTHLAGAAAAGARRLPSLRANFAWTFAGNSFYAAGQWAILSLFAKLGGSAMLGEYALAVAVTAPVVMLSHLNLRAVIATDAGRRHPFGDYLALRMASTAAALLAIVVVALFAGGSAAMIAAIIAVGAGQSAETVSDAFYGGMQRREELERVARSMIARTLLSLAAMGLTLWWTRDLLWTVAALAAGRLGVLLLYDIRAGSSGEDLSMSGAAEAWKILRTALPLGIVLMLISLNTQLPRYAVERFLGAEELGVFAAVVSLITIGATVVNALGQSATPRLALYFSEGRNRDFLRIVAKTAGLVAAMGASGVAAAWLLGNVVLAILYRPEYAAYDGLLMAAMGAGMLSYIAITLGYAVTSARVFDAQLPLFALSAATCGGMSWLLVPRMGLYGGVVALSVAAAIQIAGQMLILAWALRGRERAP